MATTRRVKEEGNEDAVMKKKKPGPWSCVKCSFINSNPASKSCTICGTPRAKLPDRALYRPTTNPLLKKSFLDEEQFQEENKKKTMGKTVVDKNDKPKKRSIWLADSNNTSEDDDGDDDLPANKRTKVTTSSTDVLIPTITAVVLPIATKMVEPVIPTLDPCSEYDVRPYANHKNSKGGNRVLNWVIYLAIKELPNSAFGRCIEKCKSIAGHTGPMAERLQLEGTRHVTLWDGKMTKQQASRIRYAPESQLKLPLTIGFEDWIPKGAYLQLNSASVTELKDMLVELDGLPFGGSKIHCDHLSLYRARGMNYGKFNKECLKIRRGVPATEWGTVQGVSIRLKVMGSDYSHCRVLAGT